MKSKSLKWKESKTRNRFEICHAELLSLAIKDTHII